MNSKTLNGTRNFLFVLFLGSAFCPFCFRAKAGTNFPFPPGLVFRLEMDAGGGNKVKDAVDATEYILEAGQAASGWTDGPAGKALRFNGKSDFVDCGRYAKFDFDDAFSASIWVMPLEQPTAYSNIFRKEASYLLRTRPDGTIEGQLLIGNRWVSTPKIPYTPGKWLHVAFTYSSLRRAIVCYKDGVYFGKTAVEDSFDYKINCLDRSLILGAGTAGSLFFHGAVGSFMLFNRELSASEVGSCCVHVRKKGDGERSFLPEAEIAFAQTPPTIDGVVDDPCWNLQKPLSDFLLNDGTGKAVEQTSVRICYDDKNLYVAFVCKESQIRGVEARVKIRDMDVWTDDCVEIFASLGMKDRYCHFAINPLGTVLDEVYVLRGGRFEVDKGWDAKGLQSAAGRNAGGWNVEAAIPFNALESSYGGIWRMNFCRAERRIPEFSCWSCPYGGFHCPDRFGLIKGVKDDFRFELAMAALGKQLCDARQAFGECSKQWDDDRRFINMPVWRKILKRRTEAKQKLEELDRRLKTTEGARDRLVTWQRLAGDLDAAREGLDRLKEDSMQAAACCRAAQICGTETPEYCVMKASPMERIFRKDARQREMAGEIEISLCRKEHEGAQLLILPFKEDLKDVEVKCGDLMGNKKSIQSENVHIYPVGYIKTKWAGDVPDPLLKMDKFSVSKGSVQPVWVDVCVPEDVPGGVYRGKLTVKPKGMHSWETKIKVNVWNFMLPRRHLLRTRVGGLRPELRELLLEYRMSPGFVGYPEIKSHKPKEFADVKPLLEARLENYRNRGMNAFFMEFPWYLPYSCPPAVCRYRYPDHIPVKMEPGEREHLIRYFRDYAEYLNAKGCLSEGYVYLWDEPWKRSVGAIQEMARIIREANPKIKRMAIGTRALIPELVGSCDIWCPAYEDCWKDPANVQFIKERQKSGEEVWVYGAPSLLYNRDAVKRSFMEVRLTPWRIWREKLDGFVFWAADYWGGNLVKIENTDCFWEDVKASEVFSPGNGVLIYPLLGDKNVFSSIRLESLRDGIEDYEYMAILKMYLDQLKKTGNGKKFADENEKLLQIPDEIVSSFMQCGKEPEIAREPEAVYQWRARIAGAIEKAMALCPAGKSPVEKVCNGKNE
ncbi:MAG: DUF6067 family protein [Verrucomicrobiae bacterium]|nr:DUF6067 family protein [Verrucomicrobiae bacterium]